MYVYTSGVLNGVRLNNVTNEVRIGMENRVSPKLEYAGTAGVKVFQFGGGLLTTDSWIKYFFNDKVNLRLGFYRDNIEQSFVSAVGAPVDGVFTGRAIDNKIYLDTHIKLKKGFKLHIMGGYGVVPAQNLPTNQYLEGRIGLGKNVYDNEDNKWVQKVDLELISYNVGYQRNLLRNRDSMGTLFGAYFSPQFYTANLLKVSAKTTKDKFTYGINAFIGAQAALSGTTDTATDTIGVSPYLSYRFNEKVTVNAGYRYFDYADIIRQQVAIDAVIKF